jgi:hypothetical protein
MGQRARRDQRQLGLRKRITRFVRALFSSGSPEPWLDPPAGGLGVREPRRPVRPSLSGTAVLEAPPEEMRDVWAVGDEDRG